MVHLTNPKYWLPNVSRTFHGRDIFAPTGAYLATGVPLLDMGEQISDPVRLSFPKPVKTAQGYQAHITIIDIFGNLTTDLPAKLLQNKAKVEIRFMNFTIQGILPSYGHAQRGDLIALVDSEEYIELAVVNGSAAALTAAQVGDTVEVIIHD